jgi:hypothetical protein
LAEIGKSFWAMRLAILGLPSASPRDWKTSQKRSRSQALNQAFPEMVFVFMLFFSNEHRQIQRSAGHSIDPKAGRPPKTCEKFEGTFATGLAVRYG